MSGALDGMRVLELGQEIQGPYAGLFLADMGAEVLKIENRETGDLARQMSVGRLAQSDVPHAEFAQYFFLLNRGKRSMTLDLKCDAGKDILFKLLARTDVLLTNFRPGVLDRLGFGFESLAERFPRLVYAVASSWGASGPWARKPSRDMLAQAASGVMAKTGKEGDPPMPAGMVAGDYSGGIVCALGVVAALCARARTGRGQRVDTSMYGSLLALQPWEIIQESLTGRPNHRAGRGHQFFDGAWGAFRTADGWLAFAGIEDSRWPGFCDAIGRPELVSDPRYAKEQRNFSGAPIHRLMEEVLPRRTNAEWMRLFEAADLFVTPVADYQDVLNSEQAAANGYIRWMDHPDVGSFRMVGNPIRLSGTPMRDPVPAPAYGADTDDVLGELGYDPDAIRTLRDAKVV